MPVAADPRLSCCQTGLRHAPPAGGPQPKASLLRMRTTPEQPVELEEDARRTLRQRSERRVPTRSGAGMSVWRPKSGGHPITTGQGEQLQLSDARHQGRAGNDRRAPGRSDSVDRGGAVVAPVEVPQQSRANAAHSARCSAEPPRRAHSICAVRKALGCPSARLPINFHASSMAGHFPLHCVPPGPGSSGLFGECGKAGEVRGGMNPRGAKSFCAARSGAFVCCRVTPPGTTPIVTPRRASCHARTHQPSSLEPDSSRGAIHRSLPV